MSENFSEKVEKIILKSKELAKKIAILKFNHGI